MEFSAKNLFISQKHQTVNEAKAHINFFTKHCMPKPDKSEFDVWVACAQFIVSKFNVNQDFFLPVPVAARSKA